MSCSPIDRLAQQIAELIVVRASGHLSDPQRRYPRWELNNATWNVSCIKASGA
jgi:beta-glucosidase